jgi:hypothetical protein
LQNLKRNINIGFRVSAEERAMIERRMKQSGVTNLRAYLLKMAIDGRVIRLSLDGVSECSRLLGNIAGNVNQIAKRANESGGIYIADIEDIKRQIAEFREKQNDIIRLLADVAGERKSV